MMTFKEEVSNTPEKKERESVKDKNCLTNIVISEEFFSSFL